MMGQLELPFHALFAGGSESSTPRHSTRQSIWTLILQPVTLAGLVEDADDDLFSPVLYSFAE